MALITYARKHPLNDHADVFSGTRGLNVGLSLHSHPYVVHASSEGCGESVYLHMIARTFLNNAVSTKFSCADSYVVCFIMHDICNSYTMGCPPVRGDNPRALASGLSYVQVDKHGITILYHLHKCRP